MPAEYAAAPYIVELKVLDLVELEFGMIWAMNVTELWQKITGPIVLAKEMIILYHLRSNNIDGRV